MDCCRTSSFRARKCEAGVCTPDLARQTLDPQQPNGLPSDSKDTHHSSPIAAERKLYLISITSFSCHPASKPKGKRRNLNSCVFVRQQACSVCNSQSASVISTFSLLAHVYFGCTSKQSFKQGERGKSWDSQQWPSTLICHWGQ